jgi:MinD superfamily P-loop ATPase
MKEIVVISGKGGTGKTSIAAAFATLVSTQGVIADCDVDAADMHLLLNPGVEHTEDFYSGEGAFIDPLECRNCGGCADVCRFDAIDFTSGRYVINPIACEGCGYCARVCRPKAIAMSPKVAGEWYQSITKHGAFMVHAKLGVGAENSGKLVAKVKKEAKALAVREEKAWIIVDGSPGIGCPVVSSLSGAHFVVLVTEPTPSGLHDLERVHAVVKRFGIPCGCIINKADLNKQMGVRIRRFLEQEKIALLAAIDFNPSFTKAMVKEQTILEYDDDSLHAPIHQAFQTINDILNHKDKK